MPSLEMSQPPISYENENTAIQEVLTHIQQQLQNSKVWRYDGTYDFHKHQLLGHRLSLIFNIPEHKNTYEPGTLLINAKNFGSIQNHLISYSAETQNLSINYYTSAATPLKIPAIELEVLQQQGFFNLHVLIGLNPDELIEFVKAHKIDDTQKILSLKRLARIKYLLPILSPLAISSLFKKDKK